MNRRSTATVVGSPTGLAQSFVTILTEARVARVATRTVMFTAKAMGYDFCPMIGCMIAIGATVEPATPKGGQLALPKVAV